ncbi:MAG: GNAT family N-acetyltransferase [Lachnospiraceae bacterium]|nr:GNAT family N-acetyltransferase [Lachnospiraceae bacterium]
MSPIIKAPKRFVRPLRPQEWGEAMQMVWRVFLRFEADEYSLDGVQNFYHFITDDLLYMMYKQGVYRVFAAFEGRKLIGMISIRDGNHISLLFVDEDYHHQGIGRALMRYLCDLLVAEGRETFVTVHSSPYAVDFYHKMGFRDTDGEKKQAGIIFTPMQFFL